MKEGKGKGKSGLYSRASFQCSRWTTSAPLGAKQSGVGYKIHQEVKVGGGSKDRADYYI